jgi:hypothetical protein
MQDQARKIVASGKRNLFFGFMVIGLLSGTFSGKFFNSVENVGVKDPNQSNFLFAIVNNSDEQTKPLLGLWLAIVPTHKNEIQWMPLYPNQGIKLKNYNDSEPILFDVDDELTWKYIDPIKNQGIWWDEFIILNPQGLEKISSSIGLTAKIPSVETWQFPESAFQEQVSFIQSICERSNLLNSSDALNSLLMLNEQSLNMITSMSNFEIINLWDKFSNSGNELNCLHPWAN